MENLLQKIKSELDSADRIALFGHENIDGDSIGGMLGLGKILEKLGKNVSYFTPYAPSKLYNFLEGIEQIKSDFDYGKYDLLVFIDFAPYERIGRFTRGKEEYFNKNKIVIFDHHYSDIPYPNALILKDEQVTSDCELMFETVSKWRPDLIDSQIATYFYLGLTTDSGNFQYDEDSKRTMKNAYELLNLGANKKLIIDKVFRNKSLNLIQFSQLVLSRLVLKGAILYSFYENSELSKYNVDEEEADYAMNLIQNIGGPKLFVLLRTRGNKVKMSLRSKGDVNCSRMATQFGGGGHLNASGCSVDLDEKKSFKVQIEEIIERMEKMM